MNKKGFFKVGILFLMALSIMILIFFSTFTSADVGPGELEGYDFCGGGNCPIWVNLTGGDMFFTDGNVVYIIANISCADPPSQDNVCNESMTVDANFSAIGGSGLRRGIFKQNGTDASWAVLEFNDTVNFTTVGSIQQIQPKNVTLNATIFNTTADEYQTYDLPSFFASVLLVNMSTLIGCPPVAPPGGFPAVPGYNISNSTPILVPEQALGCTQNATLCQDQYLYSYGPGTWNDVTNQWEICGPTFSGATTNLTAIADTGNFSAIPNFTIEVSGKAKIVFQTNVSFDSQEKSQALMEFAMKSVMGGGKIGLNDSEFCGDSCGQMTRPNLNLSARLTIYNVSYQIGQITGRPQIFRYVHGATSGIPCPPTVCSNFIWDGENITFTVSSFSDYGLTDTINVTLQNPSNLSYVNTSNVNFTYMPEWNNSVTMKNCTLYGNFTGSWLANQTNQSELVNGGTNWITNTVNASGAYLWNVYCFDNTSQYDYYSPNWTVNVNIYPAYSNNRTNTNVAGQPVNFTLDWLDFDGLSGYIFRTNNSGTWANSSFVSFSGKTNTSWNVTTLNSTNGTIVAWCYYANDSSGNMNNTSCQAGNQFILTALEQLPSTYSDNSTNTTIAGVATSFRLKWTDINGLSGYIFSIDNCTGTFSTSGWAPMTGLTNWSNVTYVTNSTGGCTIRWNVSANDTVNNWTASNIINYTVKLVDGSSCTVNSQCYGYCVHNICRSGSTHCGDGYCDTGEACTLDSTNCSSGYACTNGCVATGGSTSGGTGITGGSAATSSYIRGTKGNVNITSSSVTTSSKLITTIARYENVAIRGMNITVVNNVANIKIMIYKLQMLPSTVPYDVPGTVYHYISIEKINITDADVRTINFEFAVNKTWLTGNNVAATNITMYRWDGSRWSNLDATKVAESAQEVFYNAASPGLSIFIIGTKGILPTPPNETEQATCTENWQCADWSACTNNVQTRSCTDSNSCGTIVGKPAETNTCEVAQAIVSQRVGSILSTVIVVVAALILCVFIFLERLKITTFLQGLHKKSTQKHEKTHETYEKPEEKEHLKVKTQ